MWNRAGTYFGVLTSWTGKEDMPVYGKDDGWKEFRYITLGIGLPFGIGNYDISKHMCIIPLINRSEDPGKSSTHHIDPYP
jgi:hypothetical protein